MNTSTIIATIVVGLIILITWMYVIIMFIKMCGRVDDNIIRIVFKKEFPNMPNHPVPVDKKEETAEPEKMEEKESINENNVGAVSGV